MANEHDQLARTSLPILHSPRTGLVTFDAKDPDTKFPPIAEDYGPRGNAFSGRIKGVQIAITEAAADADHRISPEEALRVATARQ